MKKIKFAIVGCGQIGKRHAEVITQNNLAELVALIDVKPFQQLNIHQYKQPFFSSLQNFLSSKIETDIVNIATPNGLHAQQAIACLNAGKHVVIEKPMCLHTNDAQTIIDVANEKHKHVFVVMQNRYSPPVTWLKEITEKKILGKIYTVQLNCFWNRDKRYYLPLNWHGTKALDGGTLYTQFSHFIDIFYWLFGDIRNINARFKSYNHQQLTEFEDSGIISFEFGNNSSGCLNFSTSVFDKNMESSITIIAENGAVKIGGQYMNTIEYCHIKNYTMPLIEPTLHGNNYGNYIGSAANHKYVIQNVIDVLNGKAPVTTTAAEGMKVVDIIERMYNAAT